MISGCVFFAYAFSKFNNKTAKMNLQLKHAHIYRPVIDKSGKKRTLAVVNNNTHSHFLNVDNGINTEMYCFGLS